MSENIAEKPVTLVNFKPKSYAVSWTAAGAKTDWELGRVPTISLFEDPAGEADCKISTILYFHPRKKVTDPTWDAKTKVLSVRYPLALVGEILRFVQGPIPYTVVCYSHSSGMWVNLVTKTQATP